MITKNWKSILLCDKEIFICDNLKLLFVIKKYKEEILIYVDNKEVITKKKRKSDSSLW